MTVSISESDLAALREAAQERDALKAEMRRAEAACDALLAEAAALRGHVTGRPLRLRLAVFFLIGFLASNALDALLRL